MPSRDGVRGALLAGFAAVPAAATSWTIVPDINAVPRGTATTEKDLGACEAKAARHAQFMFNLQSGHCFVSDASTARRSAT